MINIENKKIEPEGSCQYLEVLKSKKFRFLGYILTSTALFMAGLNFLATKSLLNKGFSQERIEQELNPKDNLAFKVIYQNPVAQEGRDLAYYLNKK